MSRPARYSQKDVAAYREALASWENVVDRPAVHGLTQIEAADRHAQVNARWNVVTLTAHRINVVPGTHV
jgi:hypothetical protein